MKQLLVSFSILFASLQIWAQMPTYYSGIDFSQPAATVEANLKTLISNTHSALSYSSTYNYIKVADQDASNTSNVILMYNGQSISKNNTIGGNNTSGTYPEDWNREHIYPQSLISSPADADLHHLRACDGVINGNRGNLPFASGSGSYGTVSGGWYPGDEWKGDVARMIMYVYLRYNEPWTDVGSLSLFLQWNVEDPVSSFEKQRNNAIQGAQGNRNPFIDQPYLATYFWGGTPAEDLWGWPNYVSTITSESIVFYPNPIRSGEVIHFSASSTTVSDVSIYDVSGRVVYQNSTLNSNEIILSDLDVGIYVLNAQVGEVRVSRRLIVQ